MKSKDKEAIYDSFIEWLEDMESKYDYDKIDVLDVVDSTLDAIEEELENEDEE